jgi:hypothetical protein
MGLLFSSGEQFVGHCFQNYDNICLQLITNDYNDDLQMITTGVLSPGALSSFVAREGRGLV